MDEKRQVIDTPLVNKSDTVTPPATGEIIPATGMAKSIQQNGTDPTNYISQRLPEPLNPTVVDGSNNLTGTDKGESRVIPTPGSN